MLEEIINQFKTKTIAILGFGMEGKSSYAFIRKHLPSINITILDRNEDLLNQNPYLNDDINVNLVLGQGYLDGLNQYDLIIKAPGISLNNMDISDFESKITSQLGILLKYYSNKVIGITGSKGKSTTTSLIYQILKDQGKDVYLLGNIGVPVLDYIEKIKENTILVVEMAALQLEFVTNSPKYGLILNLYEEHLDHFKTLEKYFNAKLNMFKYQSSDNYSFYSSDNEALNQIMNNGNYLAKKISINSKLNNSNVYIENNFIYFTDDNKYKKLYNINDKRFLLGSHNLSNIMFCLGISELFELDITKTINTINRFKGLEHRMELVGIFDNVTYYNDAIATIPEATIHAINALKEVDTLIFGGMDRGINYDYLVDFLANSQINNLICMKDSGFKIGKSIEKKGTKNKIYYVNSLKEAVEVAKKNTAKGKICLMSPAAPSYNEFKNFQQKGRAYKELITKI